MKAKPLSFGTETENSPCGTIIDIGATLTCVERFFEWLKGGFRGLTVRHERQLSTFQSFVFLACFLIAWRILR